MDPTVCNSGFLEQYSGLYKQIISQVVVLQAKTSLISGFLTWGDRTAPVYNLLLGVPYDVPLYKTSYLLQQPIFNFSFFSIKWL